MASLIINNEETTSKNHLHHHLEKIALKDELLEVKKSVLPEQQQSSPKPTLSVTNAPLNEKMGMFDKLPGAANPMSNPASMMDGMKNQAMFMITQLGMNQFGEAFFSGFVLVKVPFPLTNSFKPMLQRGVNMMDLKLLSSSYVTATSWMFLVSFGMRDLQKLLLGDNDALADQEARQMQMQMGMGMNQMGFDAKKQYKGMSDQVDMIKHEWNLAQAEKNLLGDQYPITNISATDAFLKRM